MAADENWASYLGDSGGSHYSTLSGITTENVKHLQKVWEYRASGAGAGNRSQIQFNPLIIDGVLYGSSPELDLFALNAVSGFPKWRFTPPPGAVIQLDGHVAALLAMTECGVHCLFPSRRSGLVGLAMTNEIPFDACLRVGGRVE